MIAHHYEELFAWQLGDKFKDEVFRIVQGSPPAQRNYKYCAQILEAAAAIPKDIAEGFVRKSPRYLMQFLETQSGALYRGTTSPETAATAAAQKQKWMVKIRFRVPNVPNGTQRTQRTYRT